MDVQMNLYHGDSIVSFPIGRLVMLVVESSLI